MLTKIEDLYRTPKTFECANKETYIHIRNTLENHIKFYSKSLQKYKKGNMGLTPDYIKQSNEYKCDKKSYDVLFQKLRKLNQVNVKKFK